jgi:hypothetical protein
VKHPRRPTEDEVGELLAAAITIALVILLLVVMNR